MFRLIRNRWLLRALFAGVLMALGVGIYHVQEPMPLCAIDAGNLVPRCFTVGGQRFATLPISDLVAAAERGPLQIWDCRTGGEVGRHFEKGQILHAPVFSKSGARFACLTLKEVDDRNPVSLLHLVDLSNDTSVEVPLDDGELDKLQFTPAGDVLARRISCKEGKELQIYDGATGRLLAKYVAKLLVLEEMTDMAVLFRTQTPPAGWDLEIWSVPERRALPTLPDAGAPICSDDGRWVVFQRVSADGVPTGKWLVWSTNDARIAGEFDAPANAQFAPTIAADGRWLALSITAPGGHPVGKSGLELRELPSGHLAAALREEVLGLRLSPDGRWLAAPDPDSPDRILVMETPTLGARWSFPETVREWEFSADSHIAFTLTTDVTGLMVSELVACDSETGAVRNRFRLGSQKPPIVRMTPDRRALLVRQGRDSRRHGWLDRLPWVSRFLPTETDCVMVIDTNTARERFRLTDGEVRAALLSDDGGTLATQHDDGSLRCWDVDARKPLRWALGVPAGLAAVVVLFTVWRGRRRALAQRAAVRPV